MKGHKAIYRKTIKMLFDINVKMAEVKARMKDLSTRLADKKTPLMQMSIWLFKSVQKNFDEQSADGKAWPPLAPATLYQKLHRRRKRSTNPRMLQDTGRLKGSIHVEVGNDYASASTIVPYAPHQNFGTKNGRIPSRAFMIIRRDSMEHIKEIARAWAFEKGGQ
jgi:phage virion morphogenesis protein